MLDRVAVLAHISEVPYTNSTIRFITSTGLSNWQAYGLGIISGFIGSGNPPSAAEIAGCMGISKQSTVSLIAVLREKGFVTSVPGRVRSLRLSSSFKQGIEGSK